MTRTSKRRIKKIIRYTLLFLIGCIVFVLMILGSIEKVLMSLMNKLSFRTKFALFVLIIGVLVYTRNTTINTTEITNIMQVNKIVEVAEAEEVIECTYGTIECKIYAESLNQGLTDDEAKIVIAISKWETGNYKSNLCVNANNFGGLYYNGKFIKYDSVEDGITAFVKNLRIGYFDKGLNTIEKIQTKYCPVGASNDPTGLNKNWTTGVKYFYNKLG